MRGRFAPSPTGPLHFGSLVAALGSFADARHQSGEWVIRIEDLDRAREVPGAADGILRTLEAFGFWWEGPVLYQSQRTRDYAEALAALRARGLTYGCGCSRREIAERGRLGPEGPIYPGTCRPASVTTDSAPDRTTASAPRAERLMVEPLTLTFTDRIQGKISQRLDELVGDFVLKRADGLHAYQLAVVLDDAEQGIDSVLRGADLLLSTPRQVYLQQLLGLLQPEYAHLPLALDNAGRKISKSQAAAPVDSKDPLPALAQAWRFLGQRPLPETPGSVEDFWQLAVPAWELERVPQTPSQTIQSQPSRS